MRKRAIVGAQMQLSVNLDLQDAEAQQLSHIIGCEPSQLAGELAPYAEAAVEEYVRLFLGQKVFTRGSDIREYRLFLLIRHTSADRIPGNQATCDLFQTTISESRSLIRSVMSKYQYELKPTIDSTVSRIVSTAELVQSADHEHYEFTVDTENVVEEMNRVLAALDGTLPQVQKKRGSVSTYQLKPSSYGRLKQHYYSK